MREITNGIFFVGLDDPEREHFDELIPLEIGTSYNSYLVKGSDKIAIVDSMYEAFQDEYISNLKKFGVDHVDYLIANHGEGDHTGSLPKMLEIYPEAKIITNEQCKKNLMAMLKIDESKISTVKTGDTLDLGGKTLEFTLVPGVHWPDTMFTYCKEDQFLFSCDFLGAHYPLKDTLFADDSEQLMLSAKSYYAEIMMPFRKMCQKHLKTVETINPKYIGPSHGPIYDKPQIIIDHYRDWASDDGKNLCVMPYVSMYGHSLEMAKYVADKLTAAGIEVFLYDITRGHLNDLAVKLVDATSIILTCGMVNGVAHPFATNIANLAGVLKPKAKYGSIIGSFGWGGKLVDPIVYNLTPLKLTLSEPVLSKGRATAETFTALDKMADDFIGWHKELFG